MSAGRPRGRPAGRYLRALGFDSIISVALVSRRTVGVIVLRNTPSADTAVASITCVPSGKRKRRLKEMIKKLHDGAPPDKIKQESKEAVDSSVFSQGGSYASNAR